MRAGIPLTDEDRLPWLQQLAALLQEHVASDTPAVLACSALKPTYRRLLLTAQQPHTGSAAAHPADTDAATAAAQAADTDTGTAATARTAAGMLPSSASDSSSSQHSRIAFVLLNPPQAELLLRLQQRSAAGNHFMPPSLLESQLQQLIYMEDEMYMVFSGSGQAADDIVNAVLSQISAAQRQQQGDV